ncbi:MAG: glucuronate isomerase [Bacteroidetes bacterium]|nr:glucuronate isomerase [Bacteroidota bacterium]
MKEFKLNPDRFFDPETAVRKIARELYEETLSLPIISPHGHVDQRIFVDNKPFSNPTELFIIPDHYVFRMLYSHGIDHSELDIPKKDGSRKGIDPLKIWQIFSDNYYLFAGTPSGVWLDYEFCEVFGINEKLTSENAEKIYFQINEKLQSPEFLPRALFEKFNIALLSTTDSAADSLEYHKTIKESGWKGRIIPCFRPDGLTNLLDLNWSQNIKKLGEVNGKEITNYKSFLTSLEERRKFFKEMGATSTDHGVLTPYTHKLSDVESDKIFQKALKGNVTETDAALFTANMLMEMARMSSEDGLVMQIHAGSLRNYDNRIFDIYGLDKGIDIPVSTEYTNNLRELLNAFGSHKNFSMIIFTLDESNYSRELAPLAGLYPALKLGPSWWFHDSIEGMTRFRHSVTETAGFYNTVGFNDDTRAFVSIPARHDVARRVDANYLAGHVARHIISMEEARNLIYELTNGLVKKAYKL